MFRTGSRAGAALLSLSLSLAAALALSAPSCATRPRGAGVGAECATRYPIVLVHGIVAEDDGPLSCWGRIPEVLGSKGARVYMAGTDGLATIADNAAILAARIDEILALTGAEKVNVIAHSKGGLEARYCVSTLGLGGKVASLTTLCTPHRGSALAVYFREDLPLVNRWFASLCDLYAVAVAGDSSADAYASIAELSPESCAAFNEANPDDPRVYYRSYAAVIDEGYGVPLYLGLYEIMREREGPNDGFVSVDSARWGDFRGVVGAELGALLSHNDIQDLPFFRNPGIFDVPAFYASFVAELRSMGF
jgi:triacylglycerol lipase